MYDIELFDFIQRVYDDDGDMNQKATEKNILYTILYILNKQMKYTISFDRFFGLFEEDFLSLSPSFLLIFREKSE